jgi:hypothetical protein
MAHLYMDNDHLTIIKSNETQQRWQREFFLFTASRRAQRAQLASYRMGKSGSFPGGKAAAVWSWPLTFN